MYNEPYLQPAEPESLDVNGLLKGMYLYSESRGRKKRQANILASGVAVNSAMKAQKLLKDDWGVNANVWSVTSWNELRRDGLEVDRHNLLHPNNLRTAFITDRMNSINGPVLAVSDFMRAVQDQILPWVPQRFDSLGTDGFGLSDTRGALRRHFKVDAESITVAVLSQLVKEKKINKKVIQASINKYKLDDISAADPGNTEGSG